MSIFHQQNTLFNKDLFIHSLFILLSLALLILFPTKGVFEDLTKSVFFLVIIPALYIRFIIKDKLSNFGLTLSEPKTGIIWATAMFLTSGIIMAALIQFTPFAKNYELPSYIVDNFKLFLVYELIFTNIILFVNEYFFRGFVLSLLQKYFSSWAVAIEIVLFLIFFAIIKNINWQALPFIVLAITNSIIVYKSKSIFYAYITGLIFMIILDSYLIYSIK